MEFIVLHSKTILLSLVLLNLAIAALFILWSNGLIRVNVALKRWISTHKFEEALNIMRDVDDRLVKIRIIVSCMSLLVALILIFIYIKS